MRASTLLLPLLLALLLLPAPLARADEGDPTPQELARLILRGNPAEQALVARWLETAERAELRMVFAALRVLREAPPRVPPPIAEMHIRPQPGVPLPHRGEADDPWLPPQPDMPKLEEGQHLVNLEARILEVPAAGAKELLGAHYPRAGSSAALLSAEEAAALLRAIEAHAEAKLLSAPRVTVHDKQTANVSILEQVSYVQDYEVEVGMGGAEIADPVIGVLSEGLTLDLQPTLDEDGKHLRLESTATFAEIQRPIPEFETTLAGKQRVTIQLPEVRVSKLRATVRLADGGWVLLGSGLRFTLAGGAEVERHVLLHARVITVDAAFLQELKGPERQRGGGR